MSDNTLKVVIKADPELADIIPGYLEHRRKDIGIIKEALSSADYEAIRVAGHQMRGSGSGYGFDAITEIGRLLEEGAKGSDRGQIATALERLVEYISLVEVVYE